MKKSKVVSIALAGTLTATALLAGTYAWQSISQEATNEIIDELNPGGRLHDDFDGKNKDVYVENFTSTTDGTTIFARIRLDEYLEIGAKAGQSDEADGSKKAESIVAGAEFENNKTWTTYLWDEENSVFRDYVNLLTGGSTTYMPTFNKNKDSLAADINGTLAGPDGDRMSTEDAYDDYTDYAETATKTGTEVYDADADTTDEGIPSDEQITNAQADADGVLGINMDSGVNDDIDITILKDQTHTSKQTLSAEIISMDTWLNDKGGQPGPFWVYDNDGWVYWAQGITPDTATGCLLTGVEVRPSESFADEYYYAINVVAQFATAGDWGEGTFTTINGTDGTITKGSGTGFYKEDSGITERGLYLLRKASGATKTVTISVDENTPIPEEGLTGVPGNNTAAFRAEVKQGETVLTEGVTWSVEGNKSTNTNITQAGILTIGEDETASSVTVVAASKDEPITLEEYIVLVDNWYTVAVTQTEGNTDYAAQGSIRKFAATVQERGATDATIGVTWEVVSADENVTTLDAGTTITSEGMLTIGENETATSVKVIARCAKDTEAIGEYTVDNIIDTYTYINNYMTPLSTEKIIIDGIAWYLMAKEDGKGLLWASDNVKSIGQRAFDTKDNVWETSTMRTYLNNTFLPTLTELSTRAVETTIYTRKEYNTKADEEGAFKETVDKVFLLSEADFWGKINTGLEGKEMEAVAKDYTIRITGEDGNEVGVQLITDANAALKNSSTGWYGLRSPAYQSTYVAVCLSDGMNSYAGYKSTVGYSRPALWVNLTSFY